jgi:hypothetical protein
MVQETIVPSKDDIFPYPRYAKIYSSLTPFCYFCPFCSFFTLLNRNSSLFPVFPSFSFTFYYFISYPFSYFYTPKNIDQYLLGRHSPVYMPLSAVYNVLYVEVWIVNIYGIYNWVPTLKRMEMINLVAAHITNGVYSTPTIQSPARICRTHTTD